MDEPALAKINLWLRVVGRRADGFHLLDSYVVFADFGERVRAEPAVAFSLSIEGTEVDALLTETDAAQADNLVLRAAHAFQDRFGGPAFHFTLEKELPVAAGIGGGSADAAASLRILARNRGIAADNAALFDLALELGADVPMCLTSRAACIGGIGELITTSPCPPGLAVVVVNPRWPVSTGNVFRLLSAPYVATSEIPLYAAPTKVQNRERLIGEIRARGNDLEGPAVAMAPVIGEVRASLAAHPECLISQMSGSGGSVFGLFGDETAAASAAIDISRQHPDWWVRSAAVT